MPDFEYLLCRCLKWVDDTIDDFEYQQHMVHCPHKRNDNEHVQNYVSVSIENDHLSNPMRCVDTLIGVFYLEVYRYREHSVRSRVQDD